MIPGRVGRLSEETQASAATIGPVKSDIVKVTGGTQVDTIIPFAGGRVWGQLIMLIPVDGTLVLSAAGNILVGINPAPQNKAVFMCWVPSLAKWVVNQGV